MALVIYAIYAFLRASYFSRVSRPIFFRISVRTVFAAVVRREPRIGSNNAKPTQTESLILAAFRSWAEEGWACPRRAQEPGAFRIPGHCNGLARGWFASWQLCDKND